MNRSAIGTTCSLRRATRSVGVLAGVIGVMFGSATAYASTGSAPASAPSTVTGTSPSAADINSSLDLLAKKFAGAVTDQTFRKSIHSAVATRFDGDTETLWKSLAARPRVRSTLAGNLSREESITASNALKQIDTLAARVPQFQVAVPKLFGAWDPASFTPLVGYMPEGVDDTTLKTITAYDATGGVHVLDAQVTPRQPVIILGVNERTDASGALLPNMVSASANPSSPTTVAATRTSGRQSSETSGISATSQAQPAAAAAATSYAVELNQLRVWNVHEPWSKGDAEFSFVAKSKGCSLYHKATNVSDIDEDGALRSWGDKGLDLGSSSCTVIMYFWEDDGGSYDFNLSYNKVGLNVQMDDSDDLIGGHAHAASWFQGDSEQWYTGLDDLEYSMS